MERASFCYQRDITDYTVPHNLCFIGIGMRHIVYSNIMLFPVVHTNRQFVLTGVR